MRISLAPRFDTEPKNRALSVGERGFMLGFAGIGFLGAVDAVSRVKAGAKQFLLALTAATTAGFYQIVEVDREFFLFVLHNGVIVAR